MDASEDTLQQIGQMLLRFAIGESFLPLHIRRQGRTWEILLAASIEEYKKKNDRLKRKLIEYEDIVKEHDLMVANENISIDCLDSFLEDPE